MTMSPTSQPSSAPPSLPVVGHVPAFLRDKLGFLRQAREQFGDTVRLRIGDPVWLINDPADVEHILVTNAYNYEKSPKLTSPRGRKLSGSGLHTATGAEHLPKRRRVQPLFHRSIVQGHARLIIELADERLSSWGTGAEIDLFDEMMALTQQVLIRTVFGRDFVDRENRFARAVTTRREYIEYFFTSNLPVPEYLPLPIVWRYRRTVAYLHRVVQEEIGKRRRIESLNRHKHSHDMLSMLVATRDQDGRAMSDTEIRDEVLTLTSTGYETIGAALTWTWHLLTLHPEYQAAVQRETEWMAEDEPFDPARLDEMSLTRRVFDEALRMFPPTWIFVRVANEAAVLPSGVSIEAGDKIYLCPYTMHRHDRYYPDPDRFDPDRFTDEALGDRPKFTFFPFGGGTKLCIGEPLARLEAMITIGKMAQRYSFEAVDTCPVVPRPSIVLEPKHGLTIRLRERSPSER